MGLDRQVRDSGWSVGQLARLLDITPDGVRKRESRWLPSPAPRDGRGHRRYGRESVRSLLGPRAAGPEKVKVGENMDRETYETEGGDNRLDTLEERFDALQDSMAGLGDFAADFRAFLAEVRSESTMQKLGDAVDKSMGASASRRQASGDGLTLEQAIELEKQGKLDQAIPRGYTHEQIST